MPRDLPGTGSKTGACGVSGITGSPDFAAASRQIAGQAALLQKRVVCGKWMHEPRMRGALAPARAVHIRDSPDTTNRDLGAGQTQTTRSGPSGTDAARAPSGHGCPFGASPRSVVGVRVPDEVGPNQKLGTFGYFWAFKSDPPEGRKGESAPPERMDLPTIPMPYQRTQRTQRTHPPRTAGNRQQTRCMRSVRHNRVA